MFKNSAGFAAGEEQTNAGEARLQWQRGTRQLDTMAPKLRNKTLSLTQQLHTDREKAIALHDFVKSLPFGCVADYSSLTASEVLKLGHGDCFTKGMLFVAMLRCAGIASRLRFVSLPVHFLRGIVEPEESTIMHAMAEVLIEDRWVVTDSYVPDLTLQTVARQRLLSEAKAMGYGVHMRGDMYWNGKQDASAQCNPHDVNSMPTVDWGAAHDPETFYADPSHSELRRNFATRLKWRLAAPIVNKRVAALRATAV